MLRFDGRQRHETVRRILSGLFPNEPQTVLDVGSGTGEPLRLPEGWSLVSVDIGIAAGPDFVRGSADRLPFGDRSVDVVVCLDTLEHVSPERRKESLDELGRVACKAVLVSAPFESDEVRNAEKAVNELRSKLTCQPHPWLAEHLSSPLPDLRETREHLLSAGWRVTAVPCGYLPVWLVLMLVDQILETVEGGMDIAQQIDRIYLDMIYPHDLCEPAYRTLLVAARDPVSPASLFFPCDRRRLSYGICRILALLVSDLRLPAEGGLQKDARSVAAFRQYSKRLEEALEIWEVAYGEALGLAEQGHRRMAELERRRSFQIYRNVMHLLGKEV